MTDAGLAYRFQRDRTTREVRAAHGGLAPDSVTEDHVRIAGRLLLLRRHGGISFAKLVDGHGAIQIVVDRGVVDAECLDRFRRIRRGDWIGVEGDVMTTRSGELSVRLRSFALLGECALPLPDKWRGLLDTDTRYRQRYLDLMVNAETRRTFEIRFKVVAALRDHLTQLGFVEVESPVLGTVQGGASAAPFVTHYDALGADMYLRIALELHLKRLIVGGLDRVFEIGRVFRNEGLDRYHNPEFTMLEAYQAFADYEDMMALTEGMLVGVARSILGDDLTVVIDGRRISLTPPWSRTTLAQLIQERLGVVMRASMPLDEARRILDSHQVFYHHDWGPGRLMKELYDKRVQHEVLGPVFVTDFPLEVSPLARASRLDPTSAERFELVIDGRELCNAYSEQNDPAAQRRAFEAQARMKASGDPEASDIDLDYVHALEYALPCTGGVGIGVDRLVMLLAGVSSIREVLLFPALRPEVHLARRTGGSPLARRTPELPPTAATPPPVPPPPPTLQRPRSVRWIARLTALSGLIYVSALIPLVDRWFPAVQMLTEHQWKLAGGLVTLVIGLSLVFLAGQIAKQKRMAWWLSTPLFALAALMNALQGHLAAAAGSAAMALALVAARRQFHAPADPPSLLSLAHFIPLYLLAVLLFGVSSLLVELHHTDPGLSFGGMLLAILDGLIGRAGPYVYEHPFFARFFPLAMLTLGLSGLAVFLVLLFRPITALPPRTGEDWDHARQIVRQYGWDTLAGFALREDKSFFFSSDGRAMLAYTFLRGYALVSGDPIGPLESLPLVLDEFLRYCRNRAWNPAFLAVRQGDLPLYASRGLRHVYLGDEAIIRCDHFDLESAHKSVRDATRRIGRHFRLEVIPESKAPASLVRHLNEISERWRGKAPERGFTMSLSQQVEGQGANPEFLLCVALDERNVPAGFLRLVPVAEPEPGYTLDLMRHDPRAPNGMTEFLVARTALELKRRGAVRLSLNFAAFNRMFDEQAEQSFLQRVTATLARALNPFFQILSLRTFNAKFCPEWSPRMMVFQRPGDFPRVGLLYIGVEGLLSLPWIGRLLVPRHVHAFESQGATARKSSATT